MFLFLFVFLYAVTMLTFQITVNQVKRTPKNPLISLRSKRFQSSYYVKVRAEAKKKG